MPLPPGSRNRYPQIGTARGAAIRAGPNPDLVVGPGSGVCGDMAQAPSELRAKSPLGRFALHELRVICHLEVGVLGVVSAFVLIDNASQLLPHGRSRRQTLGPLGFRRVLLHQGIVAHPRASAPSHRARCCISEIVATTTLSAGSSRTRCSPQTSRRRLGW